MQRRGIGAILLPINHISSRALWAGIKMLSLFGCVLETGFKTNKQNKKNMPNRALETVELIKK